MGPASSEQLDGGRGLQIAFELDGRPATFEDALQRMGEKTRRSAPSSATSWPRLPARLQLGDPPGHRGHVEPALRVRPAGQSRPGSAFPPGGVRRALRRCVGCRSCGVPQPRPGCGHGRAVPHHRDRRRTGISQRSSERHPIGSGRRSGSRWSQAMVQRVGIKPVWLSTAGAGVSWLHVGLDDRPKYYGFGPYRQAA